MLDPIGGKTSLQTGNGDGDEDGEFGATGGVGAEHGMGDFATADEQEKGYFVPLGGGGGAPLGGGEQQQRFSSDIHKSGGKENWTFGP